MLILKKYHPHLGQEAFHYAIANLYRFVAMICGIRGGKCLSVNQEVLLANGLNKKAGDIKKGDLLLGFELDGSCKTTRVSAIQNTQKETALYLLSDGSSIECSTDHAFPCWNAKRKKFEEYPIGYIATRSNNYLYLLSSKQVDFRIGNKLIIHPYLLGILLGDGCITKNTVSISTVDKEILEACGSLTNLEIKQRSHACDYGLVSDIRDRQGYGSNYLVTQLRELNLMGKNSHTKFIPQEYLIAKREDRLELLAGLVDTDGCVNKKGKIEFASVSLELIKGVQFILRSLGIRTEIHERITKCNDKPFLSYRISWKDNVSIPLRIKRKTARLDQRIKQCSDRLYVKEVIPLGIKPCIDISVNNRSHLFLLNNFVATHNTYAGAREAGKQAWNSKADNLAVFGIIAPTFNMLDRTTWREFRYAMRPLIAKENDTKKIITLKNGREVYGFSAEDADKIRNVTLCGFWVDEARECKDFANLWNVLLGRVLSTGGKGFVTTSPNSFDDIHDIFIANKQKDYFALRFSTYENSFLDKLAIDELASKYDEKYMQQELLGQFVIFEGAVYYTFNRAYNAGDLAFKLAQYDPSKPLCLCCDFNVNPMAWVIAQVGVNIQTKLKEVYFIDEIYLKNSNTVEACKEFKSRFPSHNTGLNIYGDATGHARHTDSNITNWKIIESELSQYMLSTRVPTKNPAERDRINSVNGMICNSKGQRRVFVNPNRCKNLIRDLEQVSYKEGSTQIDKTKSLELTHASDAAGYFLESEFSLNRGFITGLKI